MSGRDGSGRVRLVYSTAGDVARAGEARKEAARIVALDPARQAVIVRRERSGRKGKTVTVLAPLFLERVDASALLRSLKDACGSGGTCRESVAPDGRACWQLELQGDRVPAIVKLLEARGIRAKAGG